VQSLTATLSDERATTLKALKGLQMRTDSVEGRNTELEADVSTLRAQLREEQAAVLALKRQTLTYLDELEEARLFGPDGADAGLREVLLHAAPLLEAQGSPTVERFAVQRVLQTHQAELRAVFLFYVQLDATFTKHWPPCMHSHQWFAFCRDSETAGAEGLGGSVQ